MKKIIVGVVVLAVLAGAGFGWFYYYGPCGRISADKPIQEINLVLDKWRDANDLASSTPRIGLSPAIQNLQEVKREMASLSVPACLAAVQENYVSAMEHAIRGYTAFMAQESDTTIDGFFDDAGDSMAAGTDALTATIECAPFCPAP